MTPYTAFCWSAPWLVGLPHISPMIWASTGEMPGMIARKLAALAPGRRVLFMAGSQDQIWGDPADFVPPAPADVSDGAVPAKTIFQSPWLEHGAAKRAQWFNSWLDGVKKSGTSIDFLVTDAEVGLSIWVIQSPQIRAIAADPRFTRLADSHGLHDITLVGSMSHWDACAAWNDATDMTIGGYFRSAYFEPLAAHFPGAGYSDYNRSIIPKSLVERARDLNGCRQTESEPLCGTHQSPGIYGQIRSLAVRGNNDGTDPDFTKDPLATIAWEAGTMRALVLGSSHPILPWFCARSWRGDSSGTTYLAGTPYWDELIYHSMLSGGCVNCLFWDPNPPAADVKAMNDVLAALQSQTNNSKSLKPLTTDPVPYNATTILSGAQCDDGHRLFRITVMPGATSVTFTLPSEKTPRTIAVPSGQAGVWLSLAR
jgi:hypothetical protein